MATVKITGAGITGPSAALALARAGHHVTVYEQRPADALYSAGVLGMTPGNWDNLLRHGVRLAPAELSNTFYDYEAQTLTTSPFRYIAWVDLHQELVSAARDAGARFRFGQRVSTDEMSADYVMDAGGIFSASRRLESRYSGYEIYRGISRIRSPWDFMSYHLTDGYFTIGQTHQGAAWVLFVPRRRPAHLRTVDTTTHPREIGQLPREVRHIVRATDRMIVSPMSDWTVPHHSHSEDFTRFTLGDANGPVRPVTTSGANLAVMDGLSAGQLLTGDKAEIAAHETSLLERRAFDIRLGQELESPEIGGVVADVMFAQHHQMLFLAGER